MRLVDTHSHLFLEEFADDLPEVIARAKEAGISHILMPNIDSTTIGAMLSVCHRYPGYCYPMLGLHPTSITADNLDRELAVVEQALARPNDYVAIGEIGMDLYWDKTYVQEQEEALHRQLRLALEYDLPVVIHNRDAFVPIYNVLEQYRETPLRGIMHCFGGSLDEALRLLDFPGLLLGIGGVITFKKSTLPGVVRQLPLERLVIETDSPYLTPAPNRGRRNESAYARDTLIKVAEVFGLPPAEVATITTKNALNLFRIPQ